MTLPATPAHGTEPKRPPVLYWFSLLCAAALVLVPAVMLLGNPAVLRGHPLLPILLGVALLAGLAWGLLLWRRRGERRRRTRLRAAGAWVGRLAVLGLVATLAWLNPFAYQGAGAATAAVTVQESATAITLKPADGAVEQGLVFYPGARVEALAYADLLKPAAESGTLVVILKIPLGLSLLDGNQARGAMADHPEVTTWAVGGHSLGGVSASSFALANSDVRGLLLYASFPLDSMRDRQGLQVLSLSGTKDGLSTPEKVQASRDLLPADATFTAVEGGNHAFFGSYGPQPGDGDATVSREAAQARISAETTSFMTGLGGR
ncbi:alpha/beta hydrolase [Paenarthrobacter ilicis]|uniref:alpha/beta hydrolase n=1 Tax=Paenarthrobacter ilicis TaxID=43665 RepID=UPI0038695F95